MYRVETHLLLMGVQTSIWRVVMPLLTVFAESVADLGATIRLRLAFDGCTLATAAAGHATIEAQKAAMVM